MTEHVLDVHDHDVIGSIRTETVSVREDGACNLVDVWASRGNESQFDLLDFFAESGVQRFVNYLEEDLGEHCVEIDDDEHVWVHPLVMFKYLVWCEPAIDALCLDLYHTFTQKMKEKSDESATRH